MNIYFKYCPNVFVAKCDTTYNRGDVIQVTTKYGKENDHIVFNLEKWDSSKRTRLLFDLCEKEVNEIQKKLDSAKKLWE